MRTIAVVTGTRAEYGYLQPLMNAIENDGELRLHPLITGTHLFPKFGNTYELVEHEFPSAVRIPMLLPGDTLKDMALYLASGVTNFAEYLNRNRPDILVVLGDRSESFAAALAAFYLNIPIAHINGGDVTGTTIDESIRHAITKIAHIHFVHAKKNAERLEKMGEEKKRIFITGALTLDTILHVPLPSKKELFNKYHLNEGKRTFLVMFHPITTLPDKGYSQLEKIFTVLDSLKEQTVLFYPNVDAGGDQLRELIKNYESKSYLHTFVNMPHEDYLGLMKTVDVMIGNSSSGIIEAPSFHLPVVNIGSRQQGRERSINIIDVEPEKDKILAAINKALFDKRFLTKIQKYENKFGDGRASERIVDILKKIELNESLIQKQITY
jgi:UDP-N-acetylglucosamine 2-epimerase (non-hydrolysing)/GDP/UDP-N,N'-diacetylbacillosamine 2-epimerase (hydrolysing)